MNSIKMIKLFAIAVFFKTAIATTYAQNVLYIPPLLSGTNFSLTIQSGTKPFYAGYNTPTYGVNGTWMAPTLQINKGDSITLNVTNNLNTSTTIHWHGLHVAPQNDGGPHQLINVNTTWSPSFKVRNDAATFWYHPHGINKTDLHVSKGIAGMIIVKDPIESALILPRTYGVDDIPIVVQSKAFDVLKQIAIATDMDTAMFVNGTLNPYINLPAQVVRLRLLNGSSLRTYKFGFTGGISFKMIAGDAGLLDSSITLTSLRLSPGERAEVLINLTGKIGQTIYLRNLGSLLPNGIYGASSVGVGSSAIAGYSSNPLNGSDYNMLKMVIGVPTSTPITTTPTTLTPITTWSLSSVNINRRLVFNTKIVGDSTQMAEGPFTINGKDYVMDTMNIITQLNNIEIWKLVNKTSVAHPFHIHDMHFYMLDRNGNPPQNFERGKKDVVLVMPNDSVRFITKFEDFSNTTVPYMYHCHLLHHEDDGMMGQFLVMPETVGLNEFSVNNNLSVYPNPANDYVTINVNAFDVLKSHTIEVYDALGKIIYSSTITKSIVTINTSQWSKGIYTLRLKQNEVAGYKKIIIN